MKIASTGDSRSRLPHIPGFRLIEQCGRGGSGTVYLGIDRDGVRRAVRVMRIDDGNDRVRERECAAIAGYRNLARGHEHLIDILYVGRTRSTVYCVLPLADSASERQFRYRPLTLTEKLAHSRGGIDERLRIVRAIVGAVSFLHAHGVAHRDLKPDNILFVGGVPKVADPGSSAPAGYRSNGGTREFAPPRPSDGFHADVYALGMIMYCVFTGFAPERFPELPPGWTHPFYARINRMILKCCDPETPGYRSAGELAAGLSVLTPPPSRRRVLLRAWHNIRGSVGAWAAALLLLLGLFSCRDPGKRSADEQVVTAGVLSRR